MELGSCNYKLLDSNQREAQMRHKGGNVHRVYHVVDYLKPQLLICKLLSENIDQSIFAVYINDGQLQITATTAFNLISCIWFLLTSRSLKTKVFYW